MEFFCSKYFVSVFSFIYYFIFCSNQCANVFYLDWCFSIFDISIRLIRSKGKGYWIKVRKILKSKCVIISSAERPRLPDVHPRAPGGPPTVRTAPVPRQVQDEARCDNDKKNYLHRRKNFNKCT